MKSKANTTDEAARVRAIQREAAEMARTLRAMLARSKALAKELKRLPSYKAASAATDSSFSPERVRYSGLAYELVGDLLTWQAASTDDWIATLTKGAKRTEASVRRESEQDHAREIERRAKAVAA